ncbi:hypothetical protein [Sphingomonas koreensis]
MPKAIAGVVAALLTSAVPVAAQTPAEEQAFESALTARDMTNASAHLDRLIAARLPADGKPKPDPYLNHRIGRLLLASGQPRAALSWLEGADDARETAANRGRVPLDRAAALLMLGQTTAALPLLDTALRDLGDPSHRAIALRLRVEALLASDPIAARNVLAGAAAIRARDTAAEWDWALLDARAALLTNDPAAAAKVRSAWNSAIAAPLAGAAPARAAAMMAMVEERAGNPAGALAMMAAAGRSEPDISEISSKLASTLPSCGAAITREDHVTVALHGDNHGGGARISAIAASRPEIIPHFLSGVSGAELIPSGTLSTAATIARLRCRNSPSPEPMSRAAERDPAATFMARHGLFPRFGNLGTEEEQLNTASQEVDDLTARFGVDSPMLLGPLLRLVLLSQTRVMESRDVAPTRLIELNARLERILRAVGDTSSFLPLEHNYFAALSRAVNAPSRDAAGQMMSDSFRAFVRSIDFSAAYANVIGKGEGVDPALLDSMRAELVERGVKTLASGDPRVAALRLARVGTARTAGDGTLAARVRETGLPRDLCAVQEATPRLRNNDITDDDYPPEGLIAELTGRTTLEFDLDGQGQLKAPRTIVAMPPILFDSVVAKRMAGFSYFPAETAGKAVACRAMLQSVRWKMPDREEDGPSQIMPEKWVPGS